MGTFRREWWDPMMRELFGRYPVGHPYHQESALLRYYPLAVAGALLGLLVWALA